MGKAGVMDATGKTTSWLEKVEIKIDGKWIVVCDYTGEARRQWYRNIPARLDKWQQERSEVATD